MAAALHRDLVLDASELPIKRLVRLYAHSGARARASLRRRRLHPAQIERLVVFVEECAGAQPGDGDPAAVRDGALALALLDRRIDARTLVRLVCSICDAAERVGASAVELFRDVRRYAATDRAAMMLRLADRGPDGRVR
jgi:hypothetical protein